MDLIAGYFYVYVIALILFLAVFTKNSGQKQRLATPFLQVAIWGNLALLTFEFITWLVAGHPEKPFLAINWAATYALYSVNFIPQASLIVYYDLLLMRSRRKTFKRLRWLLVPYSIYLAFTLTNPFTGIAFTIDQKGIYTRGPGMGILIGVALLTLIIYVISALPYLRRAEGKMVSGLLVMTTTPFIGAAIQFFFKGVPAMWSSLSLMLLFTVVVVEKEELSRDYLTGLFNRSQLDERLYKALKNKHSMTLVMLDMDDFKIINDTLGHDIGDDALKVFASLLIGSVRHKDIVSRYGGDEFIVLLDHGTEGAGEAFKQRFLLKLDVFNSNCQKPYQLKASIGHIFIDLSASENQFHDEHYWLSKVDALMYQEKEKRKSNF